jgi:hypothetical protein
MPDEEVAAPAGRTVTAVLLNRQRGGIPKRGG